MANGTKDLFARILAGISGDSQLLNYFLRREMLDEQMKQMREQRKLEEGNIQQGLEQLATQMQQQQPFNVLPGMPELPGTVGGPTLQTPEAQQTVQDVATAGRRLQSEEIQQAVQAERARREQLKVQRLTNRVFKSPELRAVVEANMLRPNTIPTSVITDLWQREAGPTEGEMAERAYRLALLDNLNMRNTILRGQLRELATDRERNARMIQRLSILAPEYASEGGLRRFRQRYENLLEAQAGAVEIRDERALADQFNLTQQEAGALLNPLELGDYNTVLANLTAGYPIEEIVNRMRGRIREIAVARLTKELEGKPVKESQLILEEEAIAQAIRNVFVREFERTEGFTVVGEPLSWMDIPASPTQREGFNIRDMLEYLLNYLATGQHGVQANWSNLNLTVPSASPQFRR